MPDPNSRQEDLHPAVDALIDRLRASYPDMSAFTIVSMTDRGRDFLHHLVHTRIGGLLPTILSFNDYRTRRIAEASGRSAVPEDEAFIHFHVLRCREAGRSLPPADTQRLLSFLTMIADFSVTMDELRVLDRIGPEQLDRIDRFFTTMEDFRARLASSGLFYPPFEAARFADLTPEKNELFFGLPLMTPVNERFFNRIPQDRLFVDAPLFGPQMPVETPEFETSLSLVRRIGVDETRHHGEPPEFTELAERSALPALLAGEIDDVLRERQGDGEPLFIVLLDETLSFYLWEFLFRPLGGQVNFAPWIPFTHFAAAHRLRSAIHTGQGLATARRDLVAELTARWSELDEADRSAFEGAITLCDELERFRPLIGGEWSALAEHFVATKKLRLHGRRTAPIQVVGLGDATGVPYGRAVILPMNSGVFPREPFSGPYLNLIHLPRIYRTQYEADDLALRQFLSFGRSAHIAALYNQAGGQAPSPYFSFLATEFDSRTVKRRMVPVPFSVPTGSLAIENTDELREQLRRYTWSFSSLKKFFTCSCRFILEDMQGLTPPPCFEAEDSANLLIGDFLHRFFAELKEHRPAVDLWRERFDECWEREEELQVKLPDQAVRKAIVSSHLGDIAAWEKETGRLLLFSDDVTAAELELRAPFGSGRYRLKGRLDRLQHQGDRELIADLKYKEKTSRKGLLADQVEDPDSFDDRFQLLIYAYLALHSGRAAPDRLDAAHLFLRPRVRGDYESRLALEDLAHCDETMERIARRLDALLAQECFIPNFRADGCPYCPCKALCLRPDLYRTGGRPW